VSAVAFQGKKSYGVDPGMLSFQLAPCLPPTTTSLISESLLQLFLCSDYGSFYNTKFGQVALEVSLMHIIICNICLVMLVHILEVTNKSPNLG
jgi:hypothetical protein